MSTRIRQMVSPLKSRMTLRKSYRKTLGLISTVVTEPAFLGPTKYIEDENHPNFLNRMKAGELIFGPLSLTSARKEFTAGSFDFCTGSQNSGYLYEASGDLITSCTWGTNPHPVPNRNSAIASADAKAAISALKKLNEMVIDSGELVGTMTSTVAMLRRPFAGMSKLIHKMEKIRQLKLQKFKGSPPPPDYFAKTTADTWLEQSFGWRPLFKDTATCLELYSDAANELEKRWYVARGMSKYIDVSTSQGLGTCTGGAMLGAVADVTYVRKFTYKSNCGIVYRYTHGLEDGFTSRHLGLGTNSLPLSAWNLIPYSWIADQIVGVGDWIKAATPSPGIQILQKWRTTVHWEDLETSSSLSLRNLTPPATTYSGSGGTRYDYVTNVIRVLDFDLPSYPSFSPYLGNLAQTLNNVAFGYNMISGLLKRWAH